MSATASAAAPAVPPFEVPAFEVRLRGARIGRHPVLQAMAFTLPAGRWTAIVGPNGAGKSTLLRVLAGLLTAQGEVRLLGRALADWPERERACQLAWLGQAESGGDDLLVRDVAMLGRLPHRAWLAAPSAADRAAVAGALRATHTWALRDRRLGELSGGERQRVLLARALAVQAPVLLMDEPLAHLDPPHQADWMGLVRQQVAGAGTAVSVLHELGVALQADDLLVLRAGRVLHHGPCGSADTQRALRAAFDDRIDICPVGEGRWTALPRLFNS